MSLFQQHAIGNSQPKELQQYFTVFMSDVLNSFMRNLFNVKSSEFVDILSKLHTSNAYNNTGKHFCFNNCALTSSEASLPTLCPEWEFAVLRSKRGLAL